MSGTLIFWLCLQIIKGSFWSHYVYFYFSMVGMFFYSFCQRDFYILDEVWLVNHSYITSGLWILSALFLHEPLWAILIKIFIEHFLFWKRDCLVYLYPGSLKELERQLAVKRASLPPEPASDDENAVKLVVRMPDSSRRGRRFLKSDKLQVSCSLKSISLSLFHCTWVAHHACSWHWNSTLWKVYMSPVTTHIKVTSLKLTWYCQGFGIQHSYSGWIRL